MSCERRAASQSSSSWTARTGRAGVQAEGRVLRPSGALKHLDNPDRCSPDVQHSRLLSLLCSDPFASLLQD